MCKNRNCLLNAGPSLECYVAINCFHIKSHHTLFSKISWGITMPPDYPSKSMLCMHAECVSHTNPYTYIVCMQGQLCPLKVSWNFIYSHLQVPSPLMLAGFTLKTMHNIYTLTISCSESFAVNHGT